MVFRQPPIENMDPGVVLTNMSFGSYEVIRLASHKALPYWAGRGVPVYGVIASILADRLCYLLSAVLGIAKTDRDVWTDFVRRIWDKTSRPVYHT